MKFSSALVGIKSRHKKLLFKSLIADESDLPHSGIASRGWKSRFDQKSASN